MQSAKIAGTEVYHRTLTMLMGSRSQATPNHNFGFSSKLKSCHIVRTQLRRMS